MSAAKSALVLGAGHNGLAAAIRLAQSGRSVTVLERCSQPGGVARVEEFHPGYRVPGIQHGTLGLRRRVAVELGLASFGLRFLEEPAAVFVPQLDGAGLVVRPGADALPLGLAERAPDDERAWKDWRRELAPIRSVLDALIDQAPPQLEDAGLPTLLKLARPGLNFRRLGADAMGRILRAAPMCAEDLLSDTFGDPLLRAYLASRGIEGAFLGPRSAGSGALLLLRELAGGNGVAGGASALTKALFAAAQAAGVEFKFDATVDALVLKDRRIQSVRLRDDRGLDSDLVISCLGVRSTFALMEGVVPDRERRAAERVRARGTTAAIRLALSAPLRFRGRETETFEFARIVDTTVELERAFDNTKHREACSAPWLDVAIPSATRSDFAPDGHAAVSVLVHNAPFNLDGGWTEEQKSALLEAVLSRLESHTENLRSSLVASQHLAPTDLAEVYELDGGHPMQAELGLDQLWIQRPSVHLARYETGVAGLILGGRAMHPGGEFSGSSGLIAADYALSTS